MRGYCLVSIVTVLLSQPTHAQVTWSNLDLREGHAMVENADGSGLVLFGGAGTSSGQVLNDTWRRDNGGLWAQVLSSLRPDPRIRHGMASVGRPEFASTIMFGGLDPSGQLRRDTWRLMGDEWAQVTALPTSPAARQGHAMVTHSVHKVIILFAGLHLNAPLDDTWVFDRTSWIELTPSSRPTGRYRHTMAWDGGTQRVVLFGGSGFRNDTWEFDLDTQEWTEYFPLTMPSGRVDSAMAYYPLYDQLVLFGGMDQTGTALDDTWVWNSRTKQWTEQTPSTRPPARFNHAMAHDPRLGVIVLLGGRDDEGRPGIWEWNGLDWSQRAPPPGPMAENPMAYDEARQEVVMFGGKTPPPVQLVAETWILRRGMWTKESPLNSPGRRLGHCMAYDAERRRTVLYSGRTPQGYGLDTWEWNGVNWALRFPASVPSYLTTQMVYDRSRQRIVVFSGLAQGGVAGNETWEWDGTDWEQIAVPPASRPPARTESALAYDARRQEIVVYGGVDSSAATLADTWVFANGSWTQRLPLRSPPPLSRHALEYDHARDRTVLFGGTDPAGNVNGDTWEWDGSDWILRTPLIFAPARLLGDDVAYDHDGRQVLFFGGEGPRGNIFGGLWEFGTVVSPRSATHGAGCPGSAGIPALTPAPWAGPWLGSPFEVELSSLPPGQLAVLLVAAAPLAIPISLAPLGHPSCSLLVDPSIGLPVPNVTGRATVSIQIPAIPTVLRSTFAMQGLSLDPAGQGVAVTAATVASIGSK